MVKDYLVGTEYKRRRKNPTTTIDVPSDKNVAIVDASMAQDSRDLIWKEDTTYGSIWAEDLSLRKLLSSKIIFNDKSCPMKKAPIDNATSPTYAWSLCMRC
uniref:Uncharacterized protein LOC114912593 n=1 Tax=Elaeis guineensis var. tenera TaxID=51953 RepID=A0A6I9RRF7_ELAGV|nr:uncharacterized protein LOC114912593 [Elaeis guineensis]